MICPECGAEYRAGVTVCPDCGVALVAELPRTEGESPYEYVELVTVLETGDEFKLALAKSLLEEAGITFHAAGEGLQDLFGVGRFGAGFNPLVGPARLQVRPDQAEEARAMLADLAAAAPGLADDRGAADDDEPGEPR